jgi:phage tail sheath gpL-like
LINGVTFTCAASPTGNQWAPGASATASAANLAAAINASVTSLVSGYVTASSVAGVLTITSVFYGLSGNQCTIAEGVDGGSVMTVSGARLTAGATDSGALTLQF